MLLVICVEVGNLLKLFMLKTVQEVCKAHWRTKSPRLPVLICSVFLCILPGVF